MAKLPEFPILLSFGQPNAQARLNKMFKYAKGQCRLKLFMDSGAFTERTTGKKIDLDDYIDFLALNLHRISVIANLDTREEAANIERLTREGFDVIPVVHYGDSQEHVMAISDRYPYIAIGGAGDAPVGAHTAFSRMVFETAFSRNDEIRIHGFGVSEQKRLQALPYFSADSTSWNSTRFGDLRLWHPEHKRLYLFQRIVWPDIAKKYALLQETLRFYGLSAKDFLDRKALLKYQWASIKSQIKFAEHLRKRRPGFTLYLVRLDPRFFNKEGFVEYVFGEFMADSTEHPLNGEVLTNHSGKSNWMKGRRYGEVKTEYKVEL